MHFFAFSIIDSHLSKYKMISLLIVIWSWIAMSCFDRFLHINLIKHCAYFNISRHIVWTCSPLCWSRMTCWGGATCPPRSPRTWTRPPQTRGPGTGCTPSSTSPPHSFSASEVHFLDRILLYEGMSPWQRPGHRAPSTATWAGRHCDPSWACWSQGSRGPLPRSRLKHQIESILTFVNVNIIHLIHSSWDSHSIFQLSNEEDCLFCSGSIIIVCFFTFSSRILSRVVDR